MRCIPAVYYPTTIALVDDDQDLLDGLSLSLSDHFKLQPFAFARQALKYLLKHCQHLNHKKAFYQETDESETNIQINIQFQQFIKKLQNPKRFNQIAIVIIDFDMPDINGIELARLLKSQLAVKIIMLTGAADLATAVEAFNRNDIDQFVMKSDPNHPTLLRAYIDKLQEEYFIELYGVVADSLNKRKHPLCDPDFIALFQQIFTENQIVEYYLLNDSGSFLMLNEKGQEFLLVVNTEEAFKHYYALAEDDRKATPELLRALQHKEQVVFIPNATDESPYVKDWRLYDAYKLKGKPIYYALVKPDNIIKHTKKVISYQQFLASKGT
ncbi:MAG: response regulator [Gammaproteobacteria bacterium]